MAQPLEAQELVPADHAAVRVPERAGVRVHDRAEAHRALLDLIAANRTFLVTSHARPDGDAIGSALGLAHLLWALGKEVTVAFSDPIPRPYLELAGVETIVQQQPAETADVCFVLECDSVSRTGYATMNARQLVNIDHHISGKNYGDLNWIDTDACAVGALVYELAVTAGVPLSSGFASCIYAAVLTDTGSFQFSCTNAKSFAIAAHLLELGAEASSIARAIYFSHPESKLRLLGIALSNLRIEGSVAWSTVSQEEMARAGADAEDCEGVVNFLIGLEDVRAAAFFRQQPEPTVYRLSLRSKGNLDVAAVAEGFGGGGHRSASGCTMYGTLEEVERRVLHALHALSPVVAEPLARE